MAKQAATATAQTKATATAEANPYGGTLALSDTLQGNQWNEISDNSGGCAFIGGAYHVSENVSGLVRSCGSNQVDFKDFAFQVSVMIVKGDGGGINFRWDLAKGTGYEFAYGQDGTYVVRRYDNSTGAQAVVYYTPSAAINKGLGNANTLVVVVKGSKMSFYANGQLLTGASDSTYSHGGIGFIANDGSATGGHPTDVAYSNAKVWTL
jgi:hypothetical protein